MKTLLRPFPIVTLLAVVLLAVTPARANVTLISFTATPQAGLILIRWVTASELNNAGFHLHRALDPNGPYQDISGFIVTQSDGFSETAYQFEDTAVLPGNTYYYKLESQDTSGNSQFDGPISATYGAATTTPTATATFSPSSTFTPTPTPTFASPTATLTATAAVTSPAATTSATSTATATATATRTNTPAFSPTATQLTRTATSFPTVTRPAATITRPPTTITSTSALSPTAVPTSPEPPTRTATLAPLPSLTLIFPAYTATLSPTPSPTVTPTLARPLLPTTAVAGPAGVPPRIFALLGAVALVWVLLAGFVIFFSRRLPR